MKERFKMHVEGLFDFREISRQVSRDGTSEPTSVVVGIGEGVEVRVSGRESKVNKVVAGDGSGWAARALTALNRCLSLLGYQTESDREKALARFLSWLAFVEAYVGSQDSEAKATWTEAVLRYAGTGASSLVAVDNADDILDQQMCRFPPRPLDTEDRDTTPCLTSEEQVELDAWRSEAKTRGWDKPSDLRGHAATDGAAWANDIAKRDNLIKLLEASVRRRDQDLLAYASEIDALRKAHIGTEDLPIIKANIAKLVDSDPSISLDDLADKLRQLVLDLRADAEGVSEVKQILASVLNCEASLPLSDLARGVVEMIAGRNRAAEMLAEREAAKLRAELHTVLREKATFREDLEHVKRDLDSLLESFKEIDETLRGIRAAWGIEYGKWTDLVALAKTAILPKQKPEKIEYGQRYAALCDVYDVRAQTVHMANGNAVQSFDEAYLRTSPNWLYLGKS